MSACKQCAGPVVFLFMCAYAPCASSLRWAPHDFPRGHHPHFIHNDFEWAGILFGVFFVILAVLSCILAWFTRGNSANQCICLLQKLQAEQAEAVQTKRYPAASCPICFEEFAPADGASASPSALTAAHSKKNSSKSPGSRQGTAPSAPRLDDHPEREHLLADSDRETDRAPEPNRAAAGGGKQLKPRSLSCGHTFCNECISVWMHGNNSCPICREPPTITRTDTDQPLHLSSPNANVHLNWDNALYAAEIVFRLGRLQERYPRYINSNMVSDWESHTSRGQVVDLNAVQFHGRPETHRRQDQHSESGTITAGRGGRSFGGGGPSPSSHDQGSDATIILSGRGGSNFGSGDSAQNPHGQASDASTISSGRGGRNFSSVGSTQSPHGQASDAATITAGRGGRNFGNGGSTQSPHDLGSDGISIVSGRGSRN